MKTFPMPSAAMSPIKARAALPDRTPPDRKRNEVLHHLNVALHFQLTAADKRR
jgi:hypothetical protein